MDIHTTYDSGRLTVYLSGELDHHQAKESAALIEEQMDEYLPRDCALDLSSLSFMDSSGIALIIRLSMHMKAMGGRLWVSNPSPQPQRVIDASGVDRLVPVALNQNGA